MGNPAGITCVKHLTFFSVYDPSSFAPKDYNYLLSLNRSEKVFVFQNQEAHYTDVYVLFVGIAHVYIHDAFVCCTCVVDAKHVYVHNAFIYAV